MTKREIEARFLAHDMKRSLAVRDARAAQNAAARARCRANPELCAMLLADAQRRGQSEVNWPDYFRNIDVNYP